MPTWPANETALVAVGLLIIIAGRRRR